MFQLYSPIGITTPVNPIVFQYYTGMSYGLNMPYLPIAGQPPYFIRQMHYRPIFIPQTVYPTYYRGQTFKYDSSVENSQKTKTTAKVVSAKKETKPKPVDKGKELRDEFINVAKKYSNANEADGSHLKFCINPTCKTMDAENEEWCTDFVTYVTKEAYKNKGLKAPDWFGSHDVAELKMQADSNNRYLNLADKSSRGKLIAQKVKSGDIFIFNENGASHTGFVDKVYKDGSFSTIEGNRYDKVGGTTYSPDYDKLSGFIQLS